MRVCSHCHLYLADEERHPCGVEAIDVPADEPSSALADRFQELRLLARGETGTSFVAIQGGEPAGVLKLVDSRVATVGSERLRLRRDLGKQASLSVPILARLINTGETEGELWLLREYIEGESLLLRLARGGPLSLDDATSVAVQVAIALDELHRNGLVHRDLKPAHILLCEDAENGVRVRLIDAGLTVRVDAHSILGRSRGSGYMSPEQLGGRLVSFRSDLYSLGRVYYEMLTGQKMMAQSDEETAALVSELEVPLPNAAREILLAMLSHEPRKRPFSAQQVRRTLEGLLRVPLPSEISGRARDPLSDLPPTPAQAVGARLEAELTMDLDPAEVEAAIANAGPPTEALEDFELDLLSIDQDSLLHQGRDGAGWAAEGSISAEFTSLESSAGSESAPRIRAGAPPMPVELRSTWSVRGREAGGAPPRLNQPTGEDNELEFGDELGVSSAAGAVDFASDLSALGAEPEPPSAAHGRVESEHAFDDADGEEEMGASRLGPSARQDAPAGSSQDSTLDGAPEDGESGAVRRPVVSFDVESLFDEDEPTTVLPGRLSEVLQQLEARQAGGVASTRGDGQGATSPRAKADDPPSIAGAARIVGSGAAAALVPHEDPSLPPESEPRLGFMQRGLALFSASGGWRRWLPWLTVAVTLVLLLSTLWLWVGHDGDDREAAAGTAPAESHPGQVAATGDEGAPAELLPVTAAVLGEPLGAVETGVQVPTGSASGAADSVGASTATGGAPAAAEPEQEATAKQDGERSPRRGAQPASPRRRAHRSVRERPAAENRADFEEEVAAAKGFGRQQFSARNYAEAAQYYRRASQLAPQDAGSFAGLGASLLALKRPQEAIDAYQRAVALRPRSSGFHAALGRAYYMANDKEHARTAYRDAVALDPGNQAASTALLRLGP